MRVVLLIALVVALGPIVVTVDFLLDRRERVRSQRAEARRVALDYLEGFDEGDTARIARSERPEAFTYGFRLPPGASSYVAERMTWAEYLSYSREVRAGERGAPANAPKEIRLLDVLDQTAAVKVTARWGSDYLLLGRYEGRWMISAVLWQSVPPRDSLALAA